MNGHHVARAVDWLSLGTIAAAILDYAPHAAGVLAVVWWLIRIYYEIRTGERKLRRRRGPS